MSYYPLPSDWRDLQNKTAKLLYECGFETEIEKTISTVRGKVNVDVFAINKTTTPNSKFIIECKHWNTAIPQTIVHAVRTVVMDSGANFGYIVSKKGFQSGSFDAAEYTNLKLVDWTEFTTVFEEVWRDRMFWRIFNRYSNVRNYLGANYSSLLSTPRISDELTKDGKILFDDLSRNSQFFLTSHEFLSFLNSVRKSEVSFPLNLRLTKEAQTYYNESEFSDDCIAVLNEQLAKFDDIFGKKIRELEEVWP